MNKIDIVIPTHHRREKLLNCLGSIEQAKKRLDCHCYTYIYYTDIKDLKSDNIGLSDYKFILPRLLDKPYKASQFWNDHLKQTNADMMVYLNDDVVLEIDCLRRLEAAMNVFFPDTDGVLSIVQDNIPTEQACMTAFGAIGSKFADRFPDRKVFCEDYERMYLDTELGEYALKHKKLFYEPQKQFAPLLTHFHPAFFPKMRDKTHDEVRKHLNKDKLTYEKRKKLNLLWGDSFKLIHAKN